MCGGGGVWWGVGVCGGGGWGCVVVVCGGVVGGGVSVVGGGLEGVKSAWWYMFVGGAVAVYQGHLHLHSVSGAGV